MYNIHRTRGSVHSKIVADSYINAKNYVRECVYHDRYDRAWVVASSGDMLYDVYRCDSGEAVKEVDYTEGEKAMNFTNRDDQLESQIRTLRHALQSKRDDYDTLVTRYADLEKANQRLQTEKRNLLNQRNEALALLTKDQLINLITASGSQTE